MADSRTGAAKGRRRPRKKKGLTSPNPTVNGEHPNPPPKTRERGSKSGKGKGDAVPALGWQELKALRQIVTDFLHSGESEQQLHELSKAERSQVHRMALSMGLKTASKGPENARVLHMTRPQTTRNNYDHLEGARLATNSQLIQTLEQAQPQVDRLLASLETRTFRSEQEGQLSGCLQGRRPSNYGLVGQKLVPPEPRNRNRSMVQDRQSLPIYGHRARILSLMQREQVLIIQGATGSGKSTQLPQYILEWAAKHRTPVRIVVSQPRRIAAVSICERIAKERGEAPGATVGYHIRMNSKKSSSSFEIILIHYVFSLPTEKCTSHTVLSLTTSGCLLRAMAMEGKALLQNTTHLVIDEVHERDLDTDFLLLATKLELENNPHLRLVLMSATMNLEALSAYFGRATVLNVEGRSFGVKIWHMEDILRVTGYMTWKMEDYLGEITGNEEVGDLLAAYNHNRNETDPEIDNNLIVSLLELLMRSGEKGAVIVYLPGYYDMVVLMQRLEQCLPQDQIKILLLHSQVESNEMRKAFHIYPEQLKVILSTNIGQTSITIPDLLYVIDTGRAKMKTHDAATDASQLATTWISRADAQQRAGRAGRLSHGICYRLYCSDRYAKMSEYPIPEIRRRTLDEICLLTKVAAPEEKIARSLSMALDPPQPEAVLQACSRLQILGILQECDEQITPLGRIIAELPLGVQLGKCLIYSVYYRCLGSMTIIAAYHSVRDPFVLPSDRSKKPSTQTSRTQFAGKTMSDSLAILKLYEDFTNLSRKDVGSFCDDNSLCRHSMEMFTSAVVTLRESVRRIFQLNMATDRLCCSFDDDMDMIRLTLTAGLYPKLAFVDREKKCQLVGEGDACMQVSRSSCLLGKKKLMSMSNDWLLYVEKILTADQRSTLEHTTLVNSLMVALAAGKNVRLEQRSSTTSELYLDTWIRLRCPTEFGLQLIRLRELITREMTELVETRKVNSACQWFGPELVQKMLELKSEDSASEFPNCDND
ncbi:hypothetical protein KR054_005923 [Drosophila jambulina]|nr:hypothetical protein KR054_005923 [Drosophila jambulina]